MDQDTAERAINTKVIALLT